MASNQLPTAHPAYSAAQHHGAMTLGRLAAIMVSPASLVALEEWRQEIERKMPPAVQWGDATFADVIAQLLLKASAWDAHIARVAVTDMSSPEFVPEPEPRHRDPVKHGATITTAPALDGTVRPIHALTLPAILSRAWDLAKVARLPVSIYEGTTAPREVSEVETILGELHYAAAVQGQVSSRVVVLDPTVRWRQIGMVTVVDRSGDELAPFGNMKAPA